MNRSRTREQWEAFAKRVKALFQQPNYQEMRKRFFGNTWDFHHGGCFMVSKALMEIFPEGSLNAVATWEDNPDSPNAGDWPLQHYLFQPPGMTDLYIDSQGQHSHQEAISPYQGKECRLAPVDDQWSGDGLWQGDHYEDNYLDDVFLQIKTDILSISCDLV